ncbi:MAG TPA: hypothetical protein VGL72_02385 [Bryobacteraceae bacterium]|jgi:hypothetical protein
MGGTKLAVVFLMAATALASEPWMLATDCLNVHLEGSNGIPLETLQASERTVVSIYRDIGIPVRFSGAGGRSSDAECVALNLTFVTDVPNEFHPGALAYARPFLDEGRQIEIFSGRILHGPGHNDGGILGHVMAHEIAHVLEGMDRHSSEGVMKPRWTSRDYARMAVRPLEFTPMDADLIHQGLAKRAGN